MCGICTQLTINQNRSKAMSIAIVIDSDIHKSSESVESAANNENKAVKTTKVAKTTKLATTTKAKRNHNKI